MKIWKLWVILIEDIPLCYITHNKTVPPALQEHNSSIW
jgi:hypothetical protein